MSTTISKSFTAVGAGPHNLANHLDSLNYTASGTFVGTVILERSRDGGLSWNPVVSKSAAADVTLLIEDAAQQSVWIRWRCTAYTSGTIVTQLIVTAPSTGSGGGAGVWGSITGTLTDQSDLVTELATKADDPVDLTTGVTGTLPIAKGGTNSSTALGGSGKAIVSDATTIKEHATTTATEVGYLAGVTSAIQTQINAKAPSTAPTFATSTTHSYATASTVPYFDASKNLVSSAVTPTELGYVSGVTSAIQTQLAAKVIAVASTTDNAITRFDGTAGQVQNSGITITDGNVLVMPTNTGNTTNVIQLGSNAGNIIGNEISNTTYRMDRIPTGGQHQFQESTTTYSYFAPASGFMQNGKFTGTNVWDIYKSIAKNVSINAILPADCYYSNTQVANVSTSETDLISKTIHAKTLATNGDAISGYAWGTFAANGNNKTVKLYMAGTAIFTIGPGAYNGGTWWLRFSISRTGSSTQKYGVQWNTDNATAGQSASSGTLSFTDTSNQTLKITGTSGTASNDVLNEEVRIMFRPPTN